MSMKAGGNRSKPGGGNATGAAAAGAGGSGGGRPNLGRSVIFPQIILNKNAIDGGDVVTVGTVTRLYPTGAVWRDDIYVKLLKWFENVMRALRHVTVHTETVFEACFARL